MTKVSGMAKVLVLTIVFVLMTIATGVNVKADDDNGTLPDQGTVPMSPACVLSPGKCYGKVYTIHVGDRTYQGIFYTLLLWLDSGETAQVEVDDIVYTSKYQQGGFIIEADSIDTAFFKVFNASGEMIYIADWTKEERNENCLFFEYNPNYQGAIERYAVIAPDNSFVLENRIYDVRNHSFVLAKPGDADLNLFVYQTASREYVECRGWSSTLERFPYAMDYRNYQPIIQGE